MTIFAVCFIGMKVYAIGYPVKMIFARRAPSQIFKPIVRADVIAMKNERKVVRIWQERLSQQPMYLLSLSYVSSFI